MTTSDDSSTVFKLLQPELLTEDELKKMLQLRCRRLGNLESAPKDSLVDLFRQIILPLPQRSYRANRRGKMLTARRIKAGLEGCRRGEPETPGVRNSGFPGDGSRLKPPPNSSSSGTILTTRATGSRTDSRNSQDLDKIIINDRRKSNSKEEKSATSPNPATKVPLKRTSEVVRSECGSEGKRQRVAIKWP